MCRFVDNLAERVLINDCQWFVATCAIKKLKLKSPLIMTSVTSLSKARSIDSSNFFFQDSRVLEFGGL